eukprot:TRINITY_DN68029_c6_g1_i1.p1 TRINITY_DN68029_c6_g1~~TRINITY_DN68029_c6_g1_i1.p1  ORF type:complete len:603 (+),score=67.13 TRINITY_DN68029_c6_g1_i1:35-1810(+)
MTDWVTTAREWVSIDPNPTTKAEIQGFIDANDTEELQKRFQKRIIFGTAGLRAKMQGGPAFMNQLVVLQTSQGMAEYLSSVVAKEDRKIVVGFDHRHNSRAFACSAIAVFKQAGFTVYAFPEQVGTPFVPFAVGHFKCCAGVMITASHNPKADNGFKVYGSNTCQIIPPLDDHISDAIQKNLKPWTSYELTDKAFEGTIDCLEEIQTAYTKAVIEQCLLGLSTINKDAPPLRAVYTPMHGVGCKYVEALFDKTAVACTLLPTPSQKDPDPEFPTVSFPNPEEKGALDEACKYADEQGVSLVLANDPDADRLAVAAKKKEGGWHVLTGNEIALLFTFWAWKHYKKNDKKRPFVVASTVSSKILQTMGRKEGFDFYDTLTGFKWIGNKAYDVSQVGGDFLFGYEVEIGFMIGLMSLDKDGMRTAITFSLMAQWLSQQGTDVIATLTDLYTKYGYHHMVNKYFFCYNPDNMRACFAAMQERYKAGLPFTIEAKDGTKYTVQNVRDLQTGFDSSTADKKAALPVDAKACMITFSCDDGSWFTARGSGTEPKVKYYTEVVAPTKEEAGVASAKFTETVLAEFMQAEKYGFEAPQVK